MHGTEVQSNRGGQADSEINVDEYENMLSARLAVTGLSILQHSRNLAVRAEEMAAKIAKHGKRAPVAPELPEFHGWLKQATELRVIHETRGLEGPIASDRDIVAILARFEPLYQDADRYYNG
jgi:hypothetical protein